MQSKNENNSESISCQEDFEIHFQEFKNVSKIGECLTNNRATVWSNQFTLYIGNDSCGGLGTEFSLSPGDSILEDINKS
jgi:hypothetical protein